ncbi:FGGY-family carbohydrate kinase [Hoeflea poritis]|uniref:Sugar kinase n=1 Tax=Hoeflea poritis TaxID=2993659 RepID=A0ABT4VVB3_9HYPH|nr:sugar kinase [Hoeflea poritis]MDA4848661.1 sugar kinase [Hoeflea poritis]
MTASSKSPRSVVAIDVGATNIDVIQYSAELEVIEQRSAGALRREAPPYLSLDVEHVIEFALHSIADFDRGVPVDAIVPCTHGSAVALLDEQGELVFPVMSYLAAIPDDIAEAYADIEPSYGEVFAPTNPAALTVARQLLWQETSFPEAFSRVRTILPYAQFLAYRLSGVLSAEVTSLGAQTHLWAPGNADFSALAKCRRWSDLIAPMRRAGDRLGPLRMEDINGRGTVLCGIHDSAASYLQFARHEPLVLLSTGTWIIAFDSSTDLQRLDAHRDQVANVKIDGTPIGCARFMGGEEYGRLCGEGNEASATLDDVKALISSGTFALPSFTDSGGPMPGTGGQGRILGNSPTTDTERASLATLYAALMTAFSLDRLGDTGRVVVDGVFARNDVFLALLGALLPKREIFQVHGAAGSARGAASLALPEPQPDVAVEQTPPPHVPGLERYFAAWLEKSQNAEKGYRHDL